MTGRGTPGRTRVIRCDECGTESAVPSGSRDDDHRALLATVGWSSSLRSRGPGRGYVRRDTCSQHGTPRTEGEPASWAGIRYVYVDAGRMTPEQARSLSVRLAKLAHTAETGEPAP